MLNAVTFLGSDITCADINVSSICIHSLWKYLLSTCYMHGAILAAVRQQWKKTKDEFKFLTV